MMKNFLKNTPFEFQICKDKVKEFYIYLPKEREEIGTFKNVLHFGYWMLYWG